MGLVKLNDRGVRSATTFGSLNLGSMVFIKKLTASSSATLSFLNGTSDVVFDDTYKEYLFTFKDIHPETDGAKLLFQVDTGTNTSYNQAVTSSFFTAFHKENDTSAGVEYTGGLDQAQGTAFQNLNSSSGNGNDECSSGYLRIFNPASGTFVKHFIARVSSYIENDQMVDLNVAGYFNTTTALTRVQFKMDSDAIDAGDICLYGIK